MWVCCREEENEGGEVQWCRSTKEEQAGIWHRQHPMDAEGCWPAVPDLHDGCLCRKQHTAAMCSLCVATHKRNPKTHTCWVGRVLRSPAC